MASREDLKLREIDARLKELHHVLKEIFPLWNNLDRKIKYIQSDIMKLEEEKLLLTQGQMIFDGTIQF